MTGFSIAFFGEECIRFYIDVFDILFFIWKSRNGFCAVLEKTLRGLPKPLLLGEVALRSNDGEVGQSTALSICGCHTTSQSLTRQLPL